MLRHVRGRGVLSGVYAGVILGEGTKVASRGLWGGGTQPSGWLRFALGNHSKSFGCSLALV